MKYLVLIMSLLSSIFACGQSIQRKVEIPKDYYALVESTIDGKPAITVVNTALRKFKAKDIFAWTLTLTMEFKELAENGMPTSDESKMVIDYLESLSEQIKGDTAHPNALFLARETWDGTCQMIWQVYDPKPVDKLLKEIIDNESYPRPFEYIMEHDPKWKKVAWTKQFK